MKRIIISILILFANTCVFAQFTDPDEGLKQARELAFNDKKNEAEDLLIKILEKYPNYNDVRVFLANVYSWNAKYDNSRKEFEYLLSKNEKVREYWIGIITNEFRSDNSIQSLTYCFQGLNVFPDDADITMLKAKIENFQLKPFKALETIQSYLKKYPDQAEVKKYLETLRGQIATNTITVSTGVDVFSKIFDPMQFYYIQFAKETKRGTIAARYNLQNKFNTFGSQFEIDAYPGLGKGTYAYLNVGYSKSFIFPDWRFGAQIYRNLPKAYDVSVGFRTLRFGKDNINIYTGSLGKYFGNSYVFIVPYFIPSEEGLSKSASVTYRKYGANEDQYFGFRLSAGFSPEFNRFGTDVLTKSIINLKAQGLNLTYNFKIKNNRNLMGLVFALDHQENLFDTGKYYWITSLRASYGFSY
jgi:YaiO family outer membrane protein